MNTNYCNKINIDNRRLNRETFHLYEEITLNEKETYIKKLLSSITHISMISSKNSKKAIDCLKHNVTVTENEYQSQVLTAKVIKKYKNAGLYLIDATIQSDGIISSFYILSLNEVGNKIVDYAEYTKSTKSHIKRIILSRLTKLSNFHP